MEKDTIITLEDNDKYALLDETIIKGKKFFFAVKVDEESGNPTTNYEIFEEEIENEDVYMNTIEEGEFKQAILVDFTKKYIQNIDNLMNEDKNS